MDNEDTPQTLGIIHRTKSNETKTPQYNTEN